MFSERRRRRKSRRFVVLFGKFCLCFQFPVLIWFSCYNCEWIGIIKLCDWSVQCLDSITMWAFLAHLVCGLKNTLIECV